MKRVLLLLACCGLGATAYADAKSEAQQHVDNASKMYDAKQYTQALVELNTAYTLDPQPQILYAIGQIHLQLGQCPEAITFYQRFLATTPDPGVAAAAREAIDACKNGGGVGSGSGAGSGSGVPASDGSAMAGSASGGSAMAGSSASGSGSAGSDAGTSAPTWYSDHVADALVAGGAVGALLGLALYLDARSQLDDADTATTYQGQQSLVDKAHTNRDVGVVLGIGGIALIAGGVYHYMQHRPESAPAVTVVPTRGGAAVSWSIGF